MTKFTELYTRCVTEIQAVPPARDAGGYYDTKRKKADIAWKYRDIAVTEGLAPGEVRMFGDLYQKHSYVGD